MTTPRLRVVIAALFLLAQGMLLAGRSLAQEDAMPPAGSLAAAVLKAMADTPEYAPLESHYQKNRSEKGEAWINSPLGQAVAAARNALRQAALSATLEADAKGRKQVVYTFQGVKAVLGGLVPPKDGPEGDALRKSAGAIVCRSILEEAITEPFYLSAKASIKAIENPPLPDIDRRVLTLASGAIVEAPMASPLGLPLPGPAGKAKLLPAAEDARQRGLQAAGKGDWPAAVAAFKEANALAYCSPPLMFNLALAYQRGGWPVQAAMYYRAYLATFPEAPNAAKIRAEIPGLIAEIEARSRREFDEAERLADKLPATLPAAGTKSLRQNALERMASLAFTGGLTERGEALARKAAALQGGDSPAEKNQFPDRHGLYAAAYSWDAGRVEEIVARFGNAYTPELIFNYRTSTRFRRGEWGELKKIADAFPRGLLAEDSAGDKKIWLREAGAFESLETVHGLNLDSAKELYVGTLLPDIHALFWGGRPDIAQRLARRGVEQYRKLNPGGSASPYWDYLSYLIPNAVLGDRQAIVQEVERWKTLPVKDFVDDSIIEIAALYVAASMTPADAEATIMALIRPRMAALVAATGADLPEARWPNVFPEAYFAMAIGRGDSAAATKFLEGYSAPSSSEYQTRVRRGLRFAIATGRSQLALELAEKLPHDRETFTLLNRLAANPGAGELVRERVGRYGAALSGGWRPADVRQAQEVWLHLKHAMYLSDEKQYGVIPEAAEQTAREEPEKLPVDLAGHAVVLWMGALAARLEN